MSQTPSKRPWRTCLIALGIIALVSLCCLVIAVGIGYYLYTNGQLDLNKILSFTGMGPSEIQVINLSDGSIEAQLDRINEETGEFNDQGTLDLAPYDIASFRTLSAGEYILRIDVSNGLPPNSTCTLNIKGGQIYRVVTVPEGTIIAQDRNEVDTKEELDITTTSLCQP